MMRKILFLVPTLIACGCALRAAQAPSPARRAAGSASESDAAAPSVSATRPTRAHKPRPSYPGRAPRRGVTNAMKGEPTSAKLASETRLIASTCDDTSSERIDAQLKEMRAAVDASFKDWHDGQPECWEEMRREVQNFGSGGLGLRGTGAGGGGSGASIGIGSLGTMGRGAGRAQGSSITSARRASGTNTQVAGVDEPDLVKTDGRYVYLATGGALRIVEAMNPRLVSTTTVPGTVREMFIEGDRAVVYSSLGAVGRRCTYAYDCQFAGDGSATQVSVFDVSRREQPRLVRDFVLSGSLITARRIGKAVHTVVADDDPNDAAYQAWPPGLAMCGTPENVVRAKFAKLKRDNERLIRSASTRLPTLTEKGAERAMCSAVYRTKVRDGRAFTSVVSFDLADDQSAPASVTLQSRPGAVFASDSALYVSVVHQKKSSGGRWYSYYAPSVDEASEIHKFRIGPSPKDLRYVGSGTVPGHVLNQFAMDEWYGYLRVATTLGKVPHPAVRSVVSVLSETESGTLARVGAIEGIAPGEDVRAVRFEEDRGYVVTFKKTDPLFVMDLFDPSEPKILGELKIPGFSTYMHRIDPEHLLSIGFDADDHGSFAYFDGVILQLFDVKDPTRPTLLHKEKIGTRGSSSEAATDHLAFNYFGSEGLLAIPMTICEGGGDGRNGHDLAFSGLLVYDVDVERGFTRLGGVDHGEKGADCSTWWSNARSVVKRSVFLDDLVYSVASDRVKVQNMSRFGVDLADIALLPSR